MLMFIYPIYNHNWRNISTIYIYITRLASNEIFWPSNKIHLEVGRAKDLSAPLYIQRCWEVLSPTRKKTSYSDRRFWVSYILFIIIIGEILVLFIYICIWYITRLAWNEKFSPSNKIHREVGRAKDLPALIVVYLVCWRGSDNADNPGLIGR